jgi:S1-C subfamily serine protease
MSEPRDCRHSPPPTPPPVLRPTPPPQQRQPQPALLPTPEQNQSKTLGQVPNAHSAVVIRSAPASTRGFASLDRRRRLFAGCGGVVIIALLLLAISRAPHTAQEQSDAARLVAKVDPAVVTICCSNGGGSGFLVDETGIIVTNCHVVDGVAKATVTLADETQFVVTGFLACVPGKDLVLLKIDPAGRSLPALRLAEVDPTKGEKVYAFGSPMGLAGSMSDGLVAAVRGGPELYGKMGLGCDPDLKLIQTTAPVSPGNSGGPLVNGRAEVVGINTMASIAIAQNLNFAVSATHIRDMMKARSNTVRSLGDLPSQPTLATRIAVPEAHADRPNSNQPRKELSVPTGSVRIINRKVGLVTLIWSKQNGINRIEPAGDDFKIRCQDTGKYLALKDWAAKGREAPRGHPGALRLVSDASDRSGLWRFEPAGGGYWRIINCKSGQCLEPVNAESNPLATQRVPRNGALEQQWRLEPVKSGE